MNTKDLEFIKKHIAVDRIITEYRAKHAKNTKPIKLKRCKRNHTND